MCSQPKLYCGWINDWRAIVHMHVHRHLHLYNEIGNLALSVINSSFFPSLLSPLFFSLSLLHFSPLHSVIQYMCWHQHISRVAVLHLRCCIANCSATITNKDMITLHLLQCELRPNCFRGNWKNCSGYIGERGREREERETRGPYYPPWFAWHTTEGTSTVIIWTAMEMKSLPSCAAYLSTWPGDAECNVLDEYCILLCTTMLNTTLHAHIFHSYKCLVDHCWYYAVVQQNMTTNPTVVMLCIKLMDIQINPTVDMPCIELYNGHDNQPNCRHVLRWVNGQLLIYIDNALIW